MIDAKTQRILKRVLMMGVLVFSVWWYTTAWDADRHVGPSKELIREHVVIGESPTEKDLLYGAWTRGKCDMNNYIIAKHYPIFLVCLGILALLGIIPGPRDTC